MRDRNVFGIRAALPRMSWSPVNLYNLWRRSVQKRRETDFTQTNYETLFQQRWASKRLTRAYHGDYIKEKIFKRWYIPDNLPDVRVLSRRSSRHPNGDGATRPFFNDYNRKMLLGTDADSLARFAGQSHKADLERRMHEENKKNALAPVGSLMFREVERRIDILVFRCCFAHSIYEARRLVIFGCVQLNGVKHKNPNTRLAPGDMISVDPKAIKFLQLKKEPPPSAPSSEKEEITSGDENESSEAASKESEKKETKTEATENTESIETKNTEEISTSQIESVTATPTTPPPAPPSPSRPNKSSNLTPFNLPPYASPWIFIPAYLEVSFQTCSAIYVRHPTARHNYSEIPTPYDADGEIIRFSWEWYNINRIGTRRKEQKLKRRLMKKGIFDLRGMGNIKTGWEIFGSKRGKIEPEDRVRQGKGLKGFVHNATSVYANASEQLEVDQYSGRDESEREREGSIKGSDAGGGEGEDGGGISSEEMTEDTDPPGISALRRIKEHLDKVGFVGTGSSPTSDPGLVTNLESDTSRSAEKRV